MSSGRETWVHIKHNISITREWYANPSETERLQVKGKESLVLCFSCKKKETTPSGRTILSDPHVFFSSKLDMFACVFHCFSVIIGWSTRNDSITSSPVTEKGNFASWVYKVMQGKSVYSPNQMSDCFWFLLHLHSMEQQPSRSRRIRRRLEIIITWLVFWLFPQHLIFSASVLLQLPRILFSCDCILRWLCQKTGCGRTRVRKQVMNS